jgi:hypothetical protein
MAKEKSFGFIQQIPMNINKNINKCNKNKKGSKMRMNNMDII